MTVLFESTAGRRIQAARPSALERVVLAAAHRLERHIERRVRRRADGALERARAGAQYERRRTDAAAAAQLGILPR